MTDPAGTPRARLVVAVVCPQPPLLLPRFAGQLDVAAPIRQAAVAAVRELLATGPDRVVLITGMPSAPHSLNVAAEVGHHLLHLAGIRSAGPGGSGGPEVVEVSVPDNADPATLEAAAQTALVGSGRVALLVLGDGSARRGEKAPGHLDPRATAYDDVTQTALAQGDPAALAAQDGGLADALLVAGWAPLQVLARAWGAARADARVTYSDDPFGVRYHVAVWRHPGAGKGPG
jgi:hypothetical protein